MTAAPGRRDAGYAMAALLVAMAVMVIGLAVAAPSWRHVMQDTREEELLFRGGQIADAISRYQKRSSGALPPSLDVLVKGRFLRKPFKDPMTKKGEWRFVRQGETVGGAPRPNVPTTTRPASPTGGPTLGGFVGVASQSQEQSLRVFNGRQRYDEWLFIAGQPRIVGRRAGPQPLNPTAPGQGSGRPRQGGGPPSPSLPRPTDGQGPIG